MILMQVNGYTSQRYLCLETDNAKGWHSMRIWGLKFCPPYLNC